MSFDSSPLMAKEPESAAQWHVDVAEGAEVDRFLLHQRSVKQWTEELEKRARAAEHDTSDTARTARLYGDTPHNTHKHTTPRFTISSVLPFSAKTSSAPKDFASSRRC